MKRILRVCCILLALMLVTLMFVSCGATRPVRAASRAGKTVATAGEVKILYEELYYITMNYIKELKLTYGENALQSEAVRAELERFVWEHLLTEETALLSLGYKYGIDVYKGDIADRVSEDIASIVTQEYEGNRKAYIASLEAEYMTEHYVRKSLAVSSYLAAEIELLCARNLKVDDKTVREDIEKGNFVCFRRVLVKNESDDAARATAERIRTELAAITDIGARCEAMHEAIGSADNKDMGDTLGYGYYYPRGYLSAEYEDVVFDLENYEVSEVLKTEEGYVIMMRMPLDMTYVEEHLYDLKRLYSKLEYNRQVGAEFESLKLEKTAFGEKLDLTNLPPIDIDGGSVALTVGLIAGGTLLGVGAVVGVVYAVRRKKGAK